MSLGERATDPEARHVGSGKTEQDHRGMDGGVFVMP
jgi:hypothetical protein